MNATDIENWNLLAKVRPELRSHIRCYAQQYRGENWYILHDASNGRHLRFNQSAYEFIGRMNGKHKIEDILLHLQETLEEDAPTREEISQIISQLLHSDAINTGIAANASELFKRFVMAKRFRRQRSLLNPLSIRAALYDPDRLLNKLCPYLKFLFTPAAGILWVAIVSYASVLALANIPALDTALSSDILRPGNVLLMLLCYIAIKITHEFAHAIAVKNWGGEVHEMGISLLVLMPVPYVDASAAWAFQDKYKRMLVGAAGILAELFIAALALIVWLNVGPGVVSDTAFNVVLIGSISTLLFNANPLLRFDGYYVLQDYIEIPNLGTRANRYYIYLLKKYLLEIGQSRSPANSTGERLWFIGYGAAAVAYRFVILFAIVFFLAQEYLFLGVTLAIWAIFMQVFFPLIKGLRFLAASPLLVGKRSRASVLTAGLCTVVIGAFTLIPVSLDSKAEGVVWVSDQAQLYAKTDGFIEQVLVDAGENISPKQMLITMSNQDLETRRTALQAMRRALETRAAAQYMQDRVENRNTSEELRTVSRELAATEVKIDNLKIHSAVSGQFIPAHADQMRGRYVKQGELLGYIVSPEQLIVRAAIPQSSIALLRESSDTIEVRFAHKLRDTLSAELIQQTPSAQYRLPSRALGAAGGGQIAVAGSDKSGMTSLQPIFMVDLDAGMKFSTEEDSPAGLGERVYIQFHHGLEPIGAQWYRVIRQIFLNRLEI